MSMMNPKRLATLAALIFAAGLAAASPAEPGRMASQNPAAPAGQSEAAPQKYKIEILSAAGKPRRRRNMISSESVIRVTDQNDVPVAGIAVMFSLGNLSGGSAAFTNGAASTIVTTNAAGVAATGDLAASATSTFTINVSASVPGQAPITASIPVNMSTVAASAGAGGAAAGGAAGAGAGAGVSGAVIGVVVAAGAAAAVVAAKVLTGSDSTPSPTPGPVPSANPRIRIGAGTPTVTAP